jgi:hypothetical protein
MIKQRYAPIIAMHFCLNLFYNNSVAHSEIKQDEVILLRKNNFIVYAPLVAGGWCQDHASLRITTPNTPNPGEKIDETINEITTLVRAIIALDCPQAKTARIEVIDKNGIPPLFAANAKTNWKLTAPLTEYQDTVLSTVNLDGMMPIYWNGEISLQKEEITINKINTRNYNIRAALIPQDDGRIRVVLGRCEGELTFATSKELSNSDIHVDSKERIYKLVNPTSPFKRDQIVSTNGYCFEKRDQSTWLLIKTTPQNYISFRAVIRYTRDSKRDRAEVNKFNGTLSPVFPPKPEKIRNIANAKDSTEGNNKMANAALIILGGLFWASIMSGGPSADNSNYKKSKIDEGFADYMFEKNQARDACYSAGGSVC